MQKKLLPYRGLVFFEIFPKNIYKGKTLLREFAQGQVYCVARSTQEAQEAIEKKLNTVSWEHILRKQLVRKHQTVYAWQFQQSGDIFVAVCEELVAQCTHLQDPDSLSALSSEDIVERVQCYVQKKCPERFWIVDVAQDSRMSPQHDLIFS